MSDLLVLKEVKYFDTLPSAPELGDVGVLLNVSGNVAIGYICLTAGNWTAVATGSVSAAFSAITAGTNVAALVMGTGGTLGLSGTGTITANRASGLGGQFNLVSKINTDSPYAALATDYTILCDTASGSITVTLPASPVAGQLYQIKKIAAANTMTIDGNGKNIDGAATLAVTTNNQNYTLHYDSVGTQWRIL